MNDGERYAYLLATVGAVLAFALFLKLFIIPHGG